MKEKISKVFVEKIPSLKIIEKPLWEDYRFFIAILALILSIITLSIQIWPHSPEIYGRLVWMSYSPNQQGLYLDKNTSEPSLIQMESYAFEMLITPINKDIFIKDIIVYFKCGESC